MNIKKPIYTDLSKRESQIMDIIYKLGEASVLEVQRKLPDPPGYNSVRVLLTILEKKGYLKHKKESQKYIYLPTVLPEKAKRSMLEHVMGTFFDGSAPKLVSTLLDMSVSDLSKKELAELSKMIENAKREKKK